MPSTPQRPAKDTAQSLKMPPKSVQDRREALGTEGRTVRGLARDAVWLFITGKLDPRRVPRTPYGQGKGVGRAATAGSVELSQFEWSQFQSAQDRVEEETGTRYTVSDVVWTYLTRDLLPEEAPKEAAVVERARLRAEEEGRTLSSVVREAVLAFITGDFTPSRLPGEADTWRLPAESGLSDVQVSLLVERQHEAHSTLGFWPTLDDIVYSYLETVYVPPA